MKAWTFSALIRKETMDVSAAPGGVAEPQGQIVQGGDQLPSDKSCRAH